MRMIDDLAGKAVLITGSSSGIGAAAAIAFGANRARVAVHCRRQRDAAERIADEVRRAGGEAIVLQGDVRDTAVAAGLVEATVSAFGRLDVLINNAGDLLGRRKLAEVSDAFVLDVFSVNVMSAIAASRAAIPHLRAAGGGAIVNVGSIAARTGGSLGAGIYAGCKGFIATMTRALARELAPDGIRVNGVAPGVIETPIHQHTPPEVLEAFARIIPMGRLGEARECAGTFLYLASGSLSGYITGQMIEVNGGQFMV
jgi:3-oxoacyl-[acyl-carrier protein] reductase